MIAFILSFLNSNQPMKVMNLYFELPKHLKAVIFMKNRIYDLSPPDSYLLVVGSQCCLPRTRHDASVSSKQRRFIAANYL